MIIQMAMLSISAAEGKCCCPDLTSRMCDGAVAKTQNPRMILLDLVHADTDDDNSVLLGCTIVNST